MKKELKYVMFEFDGKELSISRMYGDETGGAIENVRIPYRNLNSLISFAIRAYHAKRKTK